MAATLIPLFDLELTGGVEAPSSDLPYLVAGTEDEVEMIAALLAGISASFGGLPFQSYTSKHQGGGVWNARVRYGKREPRGADASTSPGTPKNNKRQFEIGTQSTKMFTSLRVVNSYGTNPPDNKGAIGVSGDKVEGTDVDQPTYTWSETWYFPAAAVTEAYEDGLYALAANPVNNAPFRRKQAGEVRFLGATGSESGVNEVELTFKFSAIPNVSGLYVGDIGPIDKAGWEYLDVRFEDGTDQNQLTKVPVAVYVHQVYGVGDFSALGIGS